jgi:hypothetical protein
MKNAIENQSLDFFEPIGSNCEFGFVLRRFGSERPGLFRWNGITPAHFRYLLDQKFEGAFELENLNALPPKMIMDSKYKWVFHSAIESDENKNFLHSEADLRKLHRIEKAKVFNDIALFHGRLARGGIVCVLLVEAMAQSEMRVATCRESHSTRNR